MPGPNQGIYGSMKFPPYRFTEYPKAVTRADGTKVRVESQREEIALTLDIGVAEAPAPNALQEQNVKLAQQVADMMEVVGRLQAQIQNQPEIVRQLRAERDELATKVGELSAQVIAGMKAKVEIEPEPVIEPKPTIVSRPTR